MYLTRSVSVLLRVIVAMLTDLPSMAFMLAISAHDDDVESKCFRFVLDCLKHRERHLA